MNGTCVDSFLQSHFNRQLGVENAAGVVLDNEERASAVVDRMERCQQLKGGGAGENRAGAGGIQHAKTDIADGQRFMPTAAAANNSHFPGGRRRCALDKVRVKMNFNYLRVTQRHAAQTLRDGTARLIGKRLHCSCWTIAEPLADIVARIASFFQRRPAPGRASCHG